MTLDAVAARMAAVLRLMPCTCKRTHLYHGVGVQICHRCDALANYETLTTGTSPTRATFEEPRP